MTQFRNLYLHGPLAKVYGPKHKVYAASFKDALRIVDCNHPGFLRRISRGNWHCLRGDRTIKRSIQMEEHHILMPTTGDYHLVPVATGGKGRTGKIVLTIVIGGALLATGIGGALGAFGGAAGFGASTGFLGLTYGTVALMGAGLLLGGLSMLLTPVPKDRNSPGDKDNAPTSFTFDGPVNVLEEGSAVPCLYGELIVGGVAIASDVRSGIGTSTGGSASVPGTGTSGTNPDSGVQTGGYYDGETDTGTLTTDRGIYDRMDPF